MRYRPTIIVLAAGRGSRFGGPLHKLEQPLGSSTVLGTTLRHATESQLPVVVVTTAALAPLVGRQMATRDVVALSAEEAARGVGYTLGIGVAERSGAPGWLVLPGDMPLVRPATLLAVAAALEHHAIVYAQHKGLRGHPVGFGAELYSELVKLDGDEGARRLLARFPSHAVQVDDPGVRLDVDTPAELAAVQAALSAQAAP